MILTVTLNPAVDKTIYVPGFAIDQVNRMGSSVTDPGGKGINVSKSLHAMHTDTLCLGIVGGATGSEIMNALTGMGIRHDMVLSSEPTRTNMKIVDLEKGTYTDINEPGAAVSDALLERLWQKLSSSVSAGDTVVIAGKNPPGTPAELLAQWTRKLREIGVRVCLDTIGEPMVMAVREKPNVIKPNKEELEKLLGKTLTTDDEVVAAAREITALGVKLVVVSMGADGAFFVTEHDAVKAFSPKVTVVSTVGAGDAMMAAVADALEKGCSLEEMARRATAVASATVQVSGSSPAQEDMIRAVLDKVSSERIEKWCSQ